MIDSSILSKLDDLVPLGARVVVDGVKGADVVFSTARLKSGVTRGTLLISETILHGLGMGVVGWPKVSVQYSPKARVVVVHVDPKGPLKVVNAVKGDKRVIRFPLPSDVMHVEKMRVRGEFAWGGDRRLIVRIPDKCYAAERQAVAASAIVPAALGRPLQLSQATLRASAHRDAVEAAKAAVPAPRFGSR